MEVSGDEGGLLEWTTVSTPGEREEGSTKGMLAVVGKETIFTRWIYHFSLEVQMKSSRGIAERMSGLGAEIVGRPPHPTSAVQALLPKKRVNCELRLYFELSTTFMLLAVLNKDTPLPNLSTVLISHRQQHQCYAATIHASFRTNQDANFRSVHPSDIPKDPQLSSLLAACSISKP